MWLDPKPQGLCVSVKLHKLDDVNLNLAMTTLSTSLTD